VGCVCVCVDGRGRKEEGARTNVSDMIGFVCVCVCVFVTGRVLWERWDCLKLWWMGWVLVLGYV
jgi:hypothetical protein